MSRILDQNDLTHPVHASAGEPIVIRLEENPTTGYRWRLDEFPEGKLRVVSDEFKVVHDAYGAGGVRELTFEPLEAGHFVVILRNSFARLNADSDPKARLEIEVD
jgi:inhibitor of cysteine peptidase